MNTKISERYTDELSKAGLYVKDGKLIKREKNGDFVDFAPLIYPTEVIISDEKSFVKLHTPMHDETTISMRDLIKPDKLATALADIGIPLIPKKARVLAEVLEATINFGDDVTRKRGVSTTGWIDEFKNFAIPTIDLDVEYIDDVPRSNIVPRFIKKGTIEKEIEMLRILSKERVFIVPLFGLTAPLTSITGGIFNFVLHIGGLTGKGKSLAVKTAVTLWGKPEVSIYGKNWNATLNGLETYWHSMKDVPTWVDEMENAKNLSDVVQAIYSYSEGTGRTRAYTKDGEVLNREVKTFRGTMFTTGEKGFDEVIKSVANERNAPLGLKRRVVDLDVDDLWGRVDRGQIGAILDENYGNFAPIYVQYIKDNVGMLKAVYKTEINNFPHNIEGKEKIYGNLLTALYALKDMKVIDDETYERWRSEIFIFADNDRRDFENGRDLTEKFIESFREFAAANKNNFVGACDPEKMRGVWGMLDAMNKRAYVVKSVFRDFCKKNGYVEKQVVSEMKKNGVLWSEKGRNDVKAPAALSDKMGVRSRVYCFSLETPAEIIEEAEKNGEIPI